MYEGPSLNEAALSQTWSSSRFPTSNSYFPLYSNSHSLKNWMSFLALTLVILKPPGQHLSDKNCCELPCAITVTQTTHLKSAEELHLSILASLQGSNYFCSRTQPYILISLKQYFHRKSLGPLLSSHCFPLHTSCVCKAEETEENPVLTRNLPSELHDV